MGAMGAIPTKISTSLVKIEGTLTTFQTPQEEVSRSATSELVISFYFKFPKNVIDDNNDSVAPNFPADCVEDCVCPMKTRFQYNCKIFTWPSPEL